MAYCFSSDRVHVCLTAGGAVLLDLRRDRYFGLANPSNSLAPLLSSPGTCLETTLPARESLVDAVYTGAVRVTAGDVSRFIRAWARSLWMLKRWSLLTIVQRLETRRLAANQPPLDLDQARRLLSLFFRLRAFAYTKKGQCLLDTLVLLEFLAPYGLCPTFVIGVKTQPFAAHSWVQSSDHVFNGTPEYVGRFTPILSI